MTDCQLPTAEPQALEKPPVVQRPPATEASTPLLTPGDLESFSQGRHFRAYEKMGAHLATINGVAGAYFAVWAPNAQRVQVIGPFNGWNREATPLELTGPSGIWAGFVPGVEAGMCYKY